MSDYETMTVYLVNGMSIPCAGYRSNYHNMTLPELIDAHEKEDIFEFVTRDGELFFTQKKNILFIKEGDRLEE